GLLQLIGSEATAKDHARLRQVADGVAPAVEQERIAGGDGLAPAERPAADDAIQESVARQEPASLAERQIVSPIGVEDVPPVKRRWSIVEPGVAEGVPGVPGGLIGFVLDIAQRMTPGVVGAEQQALTVSLLQVNLQRVVVVVAVRI